jgi:calcineurin-like phosphoesterase family protein
MKQVTKEIKSKSENIWFIGDLHLNHFNIIGYCERPFKTVRSMNDTLINNWNNTIKKDDQVFFMGDLCWHKEQGSTEYWWNKLNGIKTWIIGNHDSIKEIRKIEKKNKFDYTTGIKLSFEGVPFNFLLIHDANDPNMEIAVENCFIMGGWLIHGHSHNHGIFIDRKRRRICVSVEQIKYKPISLKEIVMIIKKEKK